jgi:hypothetical protein
MEQQPELFGKLFESIPIHSEEHLDVILDTMDKEHGIYYLTQAVKYAYQSGIFSIGECEVISKSIRITNKKEKEDI